MSNYDSDDINGLEPIEWVLTRKRQEVSRRKLELLRYQQRMRRRAEHMVWIANQEAAGKPTDYGLWVHSRWEARMKADRNGFVFGPDGWSQQP
jgi:hypothetical protein